MSELVVGKIQRALGAGVLWFEGTAALSLACNDNQIPGASLAVARWSHG